MFIVVVVVATAAPAVDVIFFHILLLVQYDGNAHWLERLYIASFNINFCNIFVLTPVARLSRNIASTCTQRMPDGVGQRSGPYACVA